jgi:hypothetical protein
VQNVLCCDGLLSDTALSEGNILGDRLVEVVTYLGRRGVEEEGEDVEGGVWRWERSD